MKSRAPLPSGSEKARAVRGMFDTISGRYDLVNRIMTFGMDVGWRRRAVRELHLSPGARVLDLACGTGDFCRDLARAGLRPAGFDFSFGMLAAARTEAPLTQADILALPVASGSADGITCGFALRNVVDLNSLFREMARVLRPGGRFALLEVSEPRNRLLRAGHNFYFGGVVPKIGGMLSDRSAYEYLPASVAYLPPPNEMRAMLAAAGFTELRRVHLLGGAAQLLLGTRS
ncbi:MAG: ubiquinone/menaquinone biosynthesis methyltransferase [Actinomycetota bacterium]